MASFLLISLIKDLISSSLALILATKRGLSSLSIAESSIFLAIPLILILEPYLFPSSASLTWRDIRCDFFIANSWDLSSWRFWLLRLLYFRSLASNRSWSELFLIRPSSIFFLRLNPVFPKVSRKESFIIFDYFNYSLAGCLGSDYLSAAKLANKFLLESSWASSSSGIVIKLSARQTDCSYLLIFFFRRYSVSTSDIFFWSSLRSLPLSPAFPVS